jgi:hypothetical protein
MGVISCQGRGAFGSCSSFLAPIVVELYANFFVFQANREITRIDIFLSLVQLLEQNIK